MRALLLQVDASYLDYVQISKALQLPNQSGGRGNLWRCCRFLSVAGAQGRTGDKMNVALGGGVYKLECLVEFLHNVVGALVYGDAMIVVESERCTFAAGCHGPDQPGIDVVHDAFANDLYKSHCDHSP